MTSIPKGIPHESALLTLGKRRIELTVANMESSVEDTIADVIVSIGEGMEVDKFYTYKGECIEYIAGVESKSPVEDRRERVSYLVDKALRLASVRYHRSVWLNLSDLRVSELPLRPIDSYISYLNGVKRFASFIQEKQPEEHVAEIIIGAGAVAYGTIHAYAKTSGGFFPTTMFPTSMVTPVVR